MNQQQTVLESSYTEKRKSIEQRIAEPRKKRIQLITEWLSGAWELELEGALLREQTWFDRSFKDPNLPQVAALADKVYRSACQRWFGKPPTLHLLDYESQS